MNTLKLTVKNVDYVINGNKVICNVEFTFKAFPFVVAAARDHKASSTINGNSTISRGSMIRREQILSIYAKGIATCSPNDNFNEELGKRISYSKAVIEGYKRYYQIMEASLTALHIKAINMSDNKNRVLEILNTEKKHLDNLKNS